MVVNKTLNKKIKSLLVEIGILVFLFASLSFVSGEKARLNYSGLTMKIVNLDANSFIEKKDIEALIQNKGVDVDSFFVDSINILMLEQAVNAHPSIEHAEVFVDVTGKLNVTIKQKKPIARLYNIYGECFYIDDKGKLMPLSKKHTARVVVFTGDIKTAFKHGIKKDSLSEFDKKAKEQLNQMYRLANYIETSAFFKPLIEQVYIDENNEFILTPKIGPKHIVFGSIDNCKDKFKKLKIFYKKGLEGLNWGKYNKINIKFKDQVVCTKI